MIYYGADCGKGLEPQPHTLYVSHLQLGDHKTDGGLLISQDRMCGNLNFRKPRWAQVRFKGEDIPDIEVGDWVLLVHGHWSTSLRLDIDGKEETLWFVNKKCYEEGILAFSKEMPAEMKGYVK